NETREAARKRTKNEGSQAATQNAPVTTTKTATAITPPATAPPTRHFSLPLGPIYGQLGRETVPDEDGATDQSPLKRPHAPRTRVYP
ncbi:hypothetical protein BGZ94_003827, partial [Podila epigama]